MAEATPPAKTARPSRSRAAKAITPPVKATTASAKAQVAEEKAATEATPAEVSAPDNRLMLVLVHTGTTKRYEVFTPADDSGCTGKLYLPLGYTALKILGTK